MNGWPEAWAAALAGCKADTLSPEVTLARLLLSGVALESGAAGQAVHVKTPKTGRVLRALVIGEGRMLLDVQGGSDE